MTVKQPWPPTEVAAIRAYQQTRTALYRTGEPADATDVGAVVRERTLGWGAYRTKETRVLPANGTSPESNLTVPLPAALSAAIARLLFGEALTVSGDAKATARLHEILTEGRWDTRLTEAAETASATGDVYLRAVWDVTSRAMPIPTIVHPDRVTPTFKWGHLTKAVIESVYPAGKGKVYRHLETHTAGRIDHALYLGTNDDLGLLCPLTDHPATAAIVVDADGGIDTGIDRMLVVHVPNAVPNRRFAGDPVGANLGRSDYDGLDDLFHAYTETTRSLMRDLRHGKSRINVDAAAMDTGLPGQPGSIDLDRELYVGLGATANADAAPLFEAVQFNIRVSEHRETSRHILDQILQAVGIGPSVLGVADASLGLTATEIASRDSATRQAREERTRLWTPALGEFYTTLLELDGYAFSGPGTGTGIAVAFPPAATPTTDEVARTVTALSAAEAISIRRKVAMVNPDWDDAAIDAEVALIRADSGRDIYDLGTIPG